MESGIDWHYAKAVLEWQVELGATEAILDAPVNRFDLPRVQPKTLARAAPPAKVTLPCLLGFSCIFFSFLFFSLCI